MDYFATDEVIKPKRGDLLISEPYLPDPNFERTVVLLCEHDEDGSFGFVLNKLSSHSLSDLIEGFEGLDSKVFIGGPVQQNSLHFLHDGTSSYEGDKQIIDGVTWGVDFESLVNDRSINPKLCQSQTKFFVGYSGWSSGQLEEELNAKSWIVYPDAPASIVFDLDVAELWKSALREMGGKFRVIANYPLDPRLN